MPPVVLPQREEKEPPAGVPQDHLAKGGVLRVPAGNPTITLPEYVWDKWYTMGTSTMTYTTQNNVWDAWNGFTTSATTTGIALRDITAQIKVFSSTFQNVTWQGWVEDEAERQARLDREQAAREEASRRALAAQTRRAHASERAEELLQMVLTPEERLQRENSGRIIVHGNAGGMYEIRMDGGVHGNITKVDEHGCRLGNLCVQPDMYDRDAREGLPLADGWVGQVLGIKFNEDEFVAKANWSFWRVCQAPGVAVLRPAA